MNTCPCVDRQLIRFIVRSLFLDASGYQTVLDAIPKVGIGIRVYVGFGRLCKLPQEHDYVVADGQVGGDLTKLDGLREAALVVRAVTGGLQQGWPCPQVCFSLLFSYFTFVLFLSLCISVFLFALSLTYFISHTLPFLCFPVSLFVTPVWPILPASPALTSSRRPWRSSSKNATAVSVCFWPTPRCRSQHDDVPSLFRKTVGWLKAR